MFTQSQVLQRPAQAEEGHAKGILTQPPVLQKPVQAKEEHAKGILTQHRHRRKQYNYGLLYDRSMTALLKNNRPCRI
jgi:hypothetical protein